MSVRPAGLDAVDHVPASVDHERELLGCILVREAALPLCREVGLEPEHFYLDRHQAIYRAAKRAASEGTPADALAAWTALERMGLTAEVEKGYVFELAERVSILNPRSHAQRVIELAAKRTKLEGAQLIAQGARELDEARSADLIAEGMALVTRDFTIEAEPTSREEIASLVFDYFDDQTPPEDLFRLPWDRLNTAVLGGLRRGDVTVLGGHTNVGKSWVLDHCMAEFAKQGFRCAIFATEMPRLQRALRFIASETGIPLERLMTKQGLKQQDYRKIVEAAPRMPFDYYVCHGWSADRIAERILTSNVDVAGIDVFNKIPGVEKADVASAAATRFAEVAARGRLHLIVVSHLNRNRLRDPSGRLPKPLRHDLRDTAMLETHAAQILFLHRDQDDEANVLPTGQLYWDKVRNGMKASVRVRQSPRSLRFVEHEDDDAVDDDEQQVIEFPGRMTKHDSELFA